MNDVILNWRKISKFIRSKKTGNESNGNDRAYAHEEIQEILKTADQRSRTAFLVLASTGIRIGALQSIRKQDLERIDQDKPEDLDIQREIDRQGSDNVRIIQ